MTFRDFPEGNISPSFSLMVGFLHTYAVINSLHVCFQGRFDAPMWTILKALSVFDTIWMLAFLVVGGIQNFRLKYTSYQNKYLHVQVRKYHGYMQVGYSRLILLSCKKNAKIKVAVSVDKQRTLVRIHMENL